MNLFIDTNVLLSFYHFSNDDLMELKKLVVLLNNDEINLWVTEQVEDEFNRNRESKISDAIRKLKEQNKAWQFPQICKGYSEFSDIQQLYKTCNQKFNSLIENVSKDVRSKQLEADKVIAELLMHSKKIVRSPCLIDKAKIRVDISNPPGKNGSLGDAINWESLLEVVPNENNLYFVTSDKDYCSLLNSDVVKDFLLDEWRNKKKSEIFLYKTLSEFFKAHYPEIKLESDLKKAVSIKKLLHSREFISTHAAIKSLSNCEDFSELEVNEIIRAGIDNSQVNWIICDKNIYDFYKSLIDDYEEVIEPKLLEMISQELSSCK